MPYIEFSQIAHRDRAKYIERVINTRAVERCTVFIYISRRSDQKPTQRCPHNSNALIATGALRECIPLHKNACNLSNKGIYVVSPAFVL